MMDEFAAGFASGFSIVEAEASLRSWRCLFKDQGGRFLKLWPLARACEISYRLHSKTLSKSRILFTDWPANDTFVSSHLTKPHDRRSRRAGDGFGGVRGLLPALRRRSGLLRPLAAAIAHPAVLPAVQRGGLLRLQPHHHQMAIYFAARRAEHRAGSDRADARARGAGLYFCLAEHRHHVLYRQGHHRSLLVSRGILSQRLALCLSLFPLHARSPSCAHRRRFPDAVDRQRRRCRDSFAWDRKRRGQADLAGRPVIAIECRPRPVDPQHSRARRHRRHRGCDRRFRKARQADLARGDDTLGVHSRGASRSRPDARQAARADRQPAAVAGGRRHAALDGGRGRGPAAAPKREHRLCPPRSAGRRARR